MELAPIGIRVNAICPGSVAGPRIESVYANKAAARGVDYAVVLEEALAKTSLHRLVTADDIANTIVFLCSPAGANISGQAVAVDADVQALRARPVDEARVDAVLELEDTLGHRAGRRDHDHDDDV